MESGGNFASGLLFLAALIVYCGEVSHAALLCPSFYKAQIVSNPSRWDLLRERARAAVIGWLQRGEARRRDAYAF